jgi:hypothetical protein
LASETDSPDDDKISIQVRFIREKGKAALRDGQGAQKVIAPCPSQRVLKNLVLFIGEGS